MTTPQHHEDLTPLTFVATSDLSAITKGRSIGILAVDNGLTGRDVHPGDGPLLYTIGGLIAAGVENARLVGELEQRVVTNLGLCGFTPADRARLGLTEVRKLTGLAELASRRSHAIGR